MRYRRFGQTDLCLSVFSLGTMRYLDSATGAIATIQRALELGINHIETAQGYGQSELYLGKALQTGIPRQQLYLTTKLLPTPDAATMAAGIEQSLERLGTDYIDCLALHGINTWEHFAWVTEPEGCVAAVKAAMARGQIRHIGFSTHGPLDLILALIATGEFSFVNLHYTLFQQRNAPAIAAAQAQDMGVFLISPADKGGLLYTPPRQLVELCHPFLPLHLNSRFLLSDSRITTLSVGPAEPGELDLPLVIADQTGLLTAAEAAVIECLERYQQAVLAGERCSQCHACLPCPEEINIPEVLRLRNLAVAYEMEAFGKYRYQMFENAGHWFPGKLGSRCTDCGDCLPRCPEQLDIPRLLRDTHERLKGEPRRRLWEGI